MAWSLENKAPEIVAAEDNEFNQWEFRDWPYLLEIIATTEVFGSAKTDREGYFSLPNIPIPGAYFLLIRDVKSYYPLRVPAVIPKTGAKRFEVKITLDAEKQSPQSETSDIQEKEMAEERTAPTITLKTDDQSSELLVSKEALKEIVKARKKIENKDIDKAIKHFKKALEFEPEFAEAHYNLGGLLRQQGKQAEAIEHFMKAIEFKENYPLAYFILGETLHMQGKYSESNQYLMNYPGPHSERKAGLSLTLTSWSEQTTST